MRSNSLQHGAHATMRMASSLSRFRSTNILQSIRGYWSSSQMKYWGEREEEKQSIFKTLRHFIEVHLLILTIAIVVVIDERLNS